MKDGTELTHYGVKGMKWGKRLFGKVKGVFGKPNEKDKSGSPHSILKKRENPDDAKQRRLLKQETAKKAAKQAEIGMTFSKGGIKELQNRIKEEGYPSNFYDWDIEQYNNNYNDAKKEYKKANNTRKRYSSRLNR